MANTAANKPAVQTPFNFLRLPGEIRNHIYHFVFVDRATLSPNETGLLQVSRQLREDLRPFIVPRVMYNLPWYWAGSIEQLEQRFDSLGRENIRRLHLRPPPLGSLAHATTTLLALFKSELQPSELVLGPLGGNTADLRHIVREVANALLIAPYGTFDSGLKLRILFDDHDDIETALGTIYRRFKAYSYVFLYEGSEFDTSTGKRRWCYGVCDEWARKFAENGEAPEHVIERIEPFKQLEVVLEEP